MSRSLRASPSGIERAKQALVRKCLTQKAIAHELGIASWATVNKFFTGKPIDRFLFIEICQALELDWQEITEFSTVDHAASLPEPQGSLAQIQFSVYDLEWVGREVLVEQLHDAIQGSCRILLLVGLTGIGKTALAEKLIETVRGSWLEDRENFEHQTTADFASTALKWLQQWGEVVPTDQRQPQQLCQQVLKHLTGAPHLILLDSLEEILVGNEVEGWGAFADPEWGNFLTGFLAASSCPSRLILTSQDLPLQFETAGFDRHKNLWCCHLLHGLDSQEQVSLFQKVGLWAKATQSDAALKLIGEVYDGHPLALRVIIGEIQKDYRANVDAYWKENQNYIQQVKTDLEAARQQQQIEGTTDRWQLASYTRALRRRVKERLDRTFERLSTDLPAAYLLLCSASVYRCEVEESWWLTHLEYRGFDIAQQRDAVQALRERYLVEDCGTNSEDERLVAQHHLVRSVAIEHRLRSKAIEAGS